MKSETNNLPVIIEEQIQSSGMENLSRAQEIAINYAPFLQQIDQQAEIVKGLKKGKPEHVAIAKRARLDIGKICSAVGERKKEDKQTILIAGKFIDGLYNTVNGAGRLTQGEAKEIEDHAEMIEKAIKDKLRTKRETQIAEFDVNPGIGDIADMSDEVWGYYIDGLKKDRDIWIAAEKEVERERIEAQEKWDLFDDRKEKLLQFTQFGTYEKLTLDTTVNEFIELIDEGQKARDQFTKKQAEIKEENERLKKEAALKLIADEKAEIKRQRLAKIEQDKRDKIERERLDKLRKLQTRNSNRNTELRPYIVFIRDYSTLLNSEEKQYRKQLEEIKEGAELQWMSDRKEQKRKAQEEEDQKEKEKTLNKSGKARKEMLSEIGVKLGFESCKNMDEDVWNEFYDEKNKTYQTEQNRIFTQKLKVDADRKAELAPDKERMTKWIGDMAILDIVDERMGKESVLIAGEIIDKFIAFRLWATEKVNAIK